MAFLDGLGRALKELDCFVLSQGDYIFGSLNALQGLDQGTVANVINGYRRLRGCGPSGDVSPAPADFAGGQCPGVVYEVRVDVTDFPFGSCDPNPVSERVASGLGPVRGLRFETINPSGPLCTPQGNRVFVDFGDTPSTSPIGGGGFGVEAVITSVVRLDGQPDNCGDPPGPPPPPPININVDVDVEFIGEGDDIFNITVPIEFKPFTVNFNGDVLFPFDFSLGGIDFNGDVTFGPDFDFNVSGPRFPKGGGGDEFEPGNPGDERPPAAPQSNIVGAVVIATNIENKAATEIEFVDGPDIYAPRLGSLKFAYSLGGATFWSADIDVKGDRVFIPCPFSQGADAVAVSPVPGVSLAATPIRGFALATIGDIKVVLDAA